MKKKPQIGKPVTKIPIDESKYPSLWFDNQEDLDHFDSLLRKKLYIQNSFGENGEKDFVLNGIKTTFGIFTKKYNEKVFTPSDKLKKQQDYVSSFYYNFLCAILILIFFISLYIQLANLINSPRYAEIKNARYHSYSDFDQSRQEYATLGKFALYCLIIRELPLKNFYARSFVVGFTFFYLVIHNWKIFPHLLTENPAFYYKSKYDEQILDNYPLIRQFLEQKRISNKNNPGLPEDEVWNKSQYKTFYHHHFKNYRYIFRTRRVVPWDGTFNQPVIPYLDNNDRSGLVHNGCMEIIEPRGSGNW